MKETKEKLRKSLQSVHNISYRISIKPLTRLDLNKKVFIEVIRSLRQIEERRDFMQSEIGLDMTTYEDKFFDVIENLLVLSFNEEQVKLIRLYLFQLLPDPDWNGTITLMKGKKEEVVMFKSPTDIWKVISKFEEKN
jgi:hypothetical protein